MWLVFWSFPLAIDRNVGLTGWDVVRGLCRDAVLWNMLRGSKLNRPSTRSATRTSWADSSMFERTVKPNHDSQLLLPEAVADTTEEPAADSEVVAMEEEWEVVLVVVAAKSMFPTFVSTPHLPFVNLCRAIMLTLAS